MRKKNVLNKRLFLSFLISAIIYFSNIKEFAAKEFKYHSYTEVYATFEKLAVSCSRYLKIDYAQERYGFPVTPGLCDEKPCKHLIVFMTDFSTLTADRPQIYISGLLHGDEVIGGNMLTELALFFCQNPRSKLSALYIIINFFLIFFILKRLNISLICAKY